MIQLNKLAVHIVNGGVMACYGTSVTGDNLELLGQDIGKGACQELACLNLYDKSLYIGWNYTGPDMWIAGFEDNGDIIYEAQAANGICKNSEIIF